MGHIALDAQVESQVDPSSAAGSENAGPANPGCMGIWGLHAIGEHASPPTATTQEYSDVGQTRPPFSKH
jgi:hypothetical protein